MRKALFVITLFFLFVACEEREWSYPPTWRGFTYDPSPAHPGDSVLVTAVQAAKGHYLNATEYTFSMTIYVDEDGVTKEQGLSYSYDTNYDGADNGDPTWELLIPENAIDGNYSCSFTAKWSNSADGKGGSYACVGGDGCTGSITSYSYFLYSNANGSFTMQIRQ